MKDKGEFKDVVVDKKGNLLYKAADGTIYYINHHDRSMGIATNKRIFKFFRANNISISGNS